MIDSTIGPETAQSIYDRIGSRYDWLDFYESQAKALAREKLTLAPGQNFLNVGCGTGKDHGEMQAAVYPGLAIALDLSWVMASLTARRTGGPVCQADVAQIPFADQGFDRILAAYILDIISGQQLETALTEFWRLLRPGGRLVLLSLTHGVTLASRTVVSIWEAIYRIAPVACAGCRPLQLASLLEEWPYSTLTSEIVVQFAIPSEIVVADK